MRVRDLLRPGDFAVPIPVGLRLTLQYSAAGLIEKVFKGLDYEHGEVEDVTDKLLDMVTEEPSIPNRISSVSGTGWVSGVLYTDAWFTVPGKLPMSIEDAAIDSWFNNTDLTWAFHACKVSNTSGQFQNYQTTNQWLKQNKFNSMKGFLTPANFISSTILRCVADMGWTFHASEAGPVVSQFLLYHVDGCEYSDFELSQITAGRIVKEYNEFGYILGAVTVDETDTAESTIKYPWSLIAHYNMYPEDSIVCNDLLGIVEVIPNPMKVHDPRPMSVECPVCGKVINIEDEHRGVACEESCPSMMYRPLSRFLEKMKLPELDHSAFVKMVKNKTIVKFTDIFNVEPWSGEPVQTTISDIVSALVPEGSDDAEVRQFVKRCNNSKTTLQYYLEHVDGIAEDFDIELPVVVHDWLLNPVVQQRIMECVTCPKFELMNTSKMFEGAPVMRGMNIYITGLFVHGPDSTIEQIIHSYSGEVVDDVINGKTTLVVTGDSMSNINGMMLNKAKNYHIPVIDESTFFARFGIDEDLQQYL